jgi:hypothetical protein
MGEPEYKYAIETFWSEEDDCFVACVLDLTQAHLAIQADLVSRRVFGEPIPEPSPRFLSEQSIGQQVTH